MDFYRIRLAKEAFKFSSTHFTFLSATNAERLHGHNYQVSVECELNGLDSMGMGFEFNELKPVVKELVGAWDERVLVPEASKLLTIGEELIGKTAHCTIDLSIGDFQRSYRFPKNEIVFLNTINITSEELARIFAFELANSWRTRSENKENLHSRVRTLAVTIEETRGQSATYVLQSPLLARTDLR